MSMFHVLAFGFCLICGAVVGLWWAVKGGGGFGLLGFLLGTAGGVGVLGLLRFVAVVLQRWRPVPPPCKNGRCAPLDYTTLREKTEGYVLRCKCDDTYFLTRARFMRPQRFMVAESDELFGPYLVAQPFRTWRTDTGEPLQPTPMGSGGPAGDNGEAGARLDPNTPKWELKGTTDFPSLLRALVELVPDGSILYFEGGSPGERLVDFFASHAVPERTRIASGISWPKPLVYHVPATPENLATLADLAESFAEPELAIHFHVYQDERVLLEWHDAFDQPMALAGEMSKEQVEGFARKLGMSVTRHKGAAATEGSGGI